MTPLPATPFPRNWQGAHARDAAAGSELWPGSVRALEKALHRAGAKPVRPPWSRSARATICPIAFLNPHRTDDCNRLRRQIRRLGCGLGELGVDFLSCFFAPHLCFKPPQICSGPPSFLGVPCTGPGHGALGPSGLRPGGRLGEKATKKRPLSQPSRVVTEQAPGRVRLGGATT